MAVKVTIYTDGAASGNPGPGGLGVVLISGNHRKEISRGFQITTNNRMELMAVITGLEQLRFNDCDVTIVTDSKYVSEPVNQRWLFEWERNGFKKKKNTDLWIRFLQLYRKHNVQIKWIKGHNNHPENERCDQLAVAASRMENKEEDVGYCPED